MSEETAIERVDEPVTLDRIASDLRALGVGTGDTVLVHSSLSALGWVAGGAPAVVDALQAVVSDAGTVVMPAFTGQYTDPAGWENPPVPDDWAVAIPDAMPPFRPAVTPTRSVGAVPECFRSYPGAVRGEHPTVSFAAWGAEPSALVADPPLDDPLGPDSPLARLADREADVLQLGTEWETTTSFHLAEYRAAIDAGRTTTRAKVIRDGEPTVVSIEDQVLATDDFPAVGDAFAADAGPATLQTGTVGAAWARLADQRAMVDFAVDWFEDHR